MDDKEKILLIQDAYTIFFQALQNTGLEEFCSNWYEHKNDKPLNDFEDGFAYLRNYCQLSIFTSIDAMEDIFSHNVAKHVENFHAAYNEELYAEIRNNISKIPDPDFKNFLKDAYDLYRNPIDLFNYCEESEFVDQWVSLVEKADGIISDNFTQNDCDVIKVKIGILEEDEPLLLCTVNIDVPTFLKQHDQIFYESDPIVSPDIALHEFRQSLREMQLNVPK